ncbi:MAG TPA: hypothetical protein RMH99_23190 [Sandaracinaceae bacterium LLY-WYZ-13_1]|nr:hypothetical protein [Sandaracinaceae bacterium LLY-WYZ-13_1]
MHAVGSVVTLALTRPASEREALIDEAVAFGQGYLARAVDEA